MKQVWLNMLKTKINRSMLDMQLQNISAIMIQDDDLRMIGTKLEYKKDTSSSTEGRNSVKMKMTNHKLIFLGDVI